MEKSCWTFQTHLTRAMLASQGKSKAKETFGARKASADLKRTDIAVTGLKTTEGKDKGRNGRGVGVASSVAH